MQASDGTAPPRLDYYPSRICTSATTGCATWTVDAVHAQVPSEQWTVTGGRARHLSSPTCNEAEQGARARQTSPASSSSSCTTRLLPAAVNASNKLHAKHPGRFHACRGPWGRSARYQLSGINAVACHPSPPHAASLGNFSLELINRNLLTRPQHHGFRARGTAFYKPPINPLTAP